MDTIDSTHLQRAIDMAARALATGNEPFGSVLVGADGTILAEDHNRESEGDPTLHPEITLARWAALNLSAQERAHATVYTSGEHCAMCSSAHARCGLGPIVFAASTEQLGAWWAELGAERGSLAPLTIAEVAPHLSVRGPFPEYAELVHQLLIARFRPV
ncbi:nucleoside deaminase [Aeromicrobium sp. CF3.5]|uniref:nucleoside deaminase n=1 Tax=Aeromicrobium sp. CF3.5 TaxID=3373078 RepID=UPI003EE7E9BF